MQGKIREQRESCALERVGLVAAGVKGVPAEQAVRASWRISVTMFRLEKGKCQ